MEKINATLAKVWRLFFNKKTEVTVY